VIRGLFFTLLFCASLFAQKVLYLSYDKIPQRVIKGEIFPVTLKVLSTVKDFDDISYDFSNSVGVTVLDTLPLREQKGKFFYDTFHMLVTTSQAKLPDITASLIAPQEYNATTLQGKKLNVITLNPKENFSNIIADDFALKKYKTTVYDTKHNIIVFVATAKNCNIKAMHFNNVSKQGFVSLTQDYNSSQITYYAVIDKHLENFSFTYFHLPSNSYKHINIPIVVDDDSVTTQSDLKPRDQSHDKIKIYIALSVALFFLLLFFIRRKYIYLFLLLLALGYALYLAIPQQEVCIKKGAKIYLLPVTNGTVFETAQTEFHLPKEGSVANFTKIKLNNEKIGWVKNEDTCTY